MRIERLTSFSYICDSGTGLGIWNTNSPYVAVGVAAVLVTAFAAAIAVRYRHYGVYETHEDDQLVDDEDLLRNPVVVLDRNQESYINLKYPVLVSNAKVELT